MVLLGREVQARVKEQRFTDQENGGKFSWFRHEVERKRVEKQVSAR